MTAESTIQSSTEAELAQLIVSTLNLDQTADGIDPEAPLYGDAGLGLDSIDMLEISLTVSQRFGVKLRADAEIFASLRSLNAYIQGQREP
jgi:acyl carrier protein